MVNQSMVNQLSISLINAIAYYYVKIIIYNIHLLIRIMAESTNQKTLVIDSIKSIHTNILYICNKGIESIFHNQFYKRMNPIFYTNKLI